MINADRILKLLNGYKISNILFWAARKELFSCFNQERNIEELSELLQTNPESMEIIMEILKCEEIVFEQEGKYQISQEFVPLLDEKSEINMLNLIKLEGYLAEKYLSFQALEEVMENDEAHDQFNENGKENQESTYGLAMENGGRFTSLYIARIFRDIISGNILDIGGAIGHYSIQIAKHNPCVHIDIIDKLEMKSLCEQNVRKNGLEDRITFHTGDIVQYGLKTGYEGVLLSNVLHLLKKTDRELLFGKIASSMSPGGKLVLHDFFLHDRKTESMTESIFLYDWLLNGSKFHMKLLDIEEIAKRNGLGVVKSYAFPNSPTSIIVLKKEC